MTQTPLNHPHAEQNACFSTATPADIDAMLQIEQASHFEPWSRNSFAEIIANQGSTCGNYVVQLLWQDNPNNQQTQVLQGYFVALIGFEEMHLLNIAVHPQHRGKGCAYLLLQHLQHWAQWCQARSILLEVRQSNARAQTIYRQFGFEPIAVRKDYYPAPDGREDAQVMHLLLPPA